MKLDFIQKCMYQEKKGLKIAFLSILFAVLILEVILLWNYAGFLFGYGNIQTAEQLQRFSNSPFYAGKVTFEQAYDLEDSITITTTQSELTLLTPIGGGTIPSQSNKNEESFFVYLLDIGKDSIIYCAKEKVDLSKNNMTLCKRNEKVEQEIINRYQEVLVGQENVYVFYQMAEGSKITAGVLGGIAILLILAILFLRSSKWIQRHSQLGKQIQALESDYEATLAKMKEEVKNPIYQSGIELICQHYIFLYDIYSIQKSTVTQIIPMQWIKKIESYPHPEYKEEIIEIKITYQEGSIQKEYCMNVYDKITEEKIVRHITNQISKT